MSDWRTIRQDLVEETRAAVDERSIDKVLVQALEWHKIFHVFFNEKTVSISTVIDQVKYDLPSDFLQRVGGVYYRHSGSLNKIPMEVKTWDWMESLTNRFGADEFSSEIHGYPRVCAIRPKASYSGIDEIYVAPTPAVAGDEISMRYVADLGTPQLQYSPEYQWRVLDPSTGNPLSQTFTQRWLQDGYYAIRAYAKYLYNKKHTRDSDEAAAAQEEWQGELANLRRVTARSRKPGAVTPYLKAR